MIHISLFSGIGGFELAAEWMGWRNYVSCDINEFGNRVRKHYWANCYTHTDIKTLTYEIINEELSARYGSDWRNDDIIVTGGFPCQPYSSAGKRLGKADERHLWPEMLRVISEIKPTYIVGENVYGLTNWNGGVVFEEVCAELEDCGYAVQPVLLPASGIGAPHHRMRVWVVAHANRNDGRSTDRESRCEESKTNAEGEQSVYSRTWTTSNEGYATHANSNGQFKGRRYDGSSENDERSNPSQQRSKDTKNLNRCSTDGISQKQFTNCGGIGEQTDVKTNQTTSSREICRMDEANNTEKIIGNNQFTIDKSRALVSERHKGIFTSTKRGLECNQTSFRELATMGLSIDLSRINRMERDAAHANSNGQHQCNGNNEVNASEGREYALNDFNENVGQRVIINTNSERLKGSMPTELIGQFPNEKGSNEINLLSNGRRREELSFARFPTQSPICGGDDGLPNQLDGITFFKWRQQSIMAYGNAVVPQLVYQIFKAIDDTHRTHPSNPRPQDG